jgi:hypothetical protein
MSAAPLAPVYDADFVEIGDERQGDRRARDRRAAHLKLDPRFAVTLINQIAGPEQRCTSLYRAGQRYSRTGAIANVSA